MEGVGFISDQIKPEKVVKDSLFSKTHYSLRGTVWPSTSNCTLHPSLSRTSIIIAKTKILEHGKQRFDMIKKTKALFNIVKFQIFSGLATHIISKNKIFITSNNKISIIIKKCTGFYQIKILFLLMMGVAKCETFRRFTTLNKALLFLIKLNKTAVQSVPNKDLIFSLIGP